MLTKFLPIFFSQIILCQGLENSNTSPMHVLGIVKKIDVFERQDTTFNPSWVKELKLLLPCKNTKVPKKYLPN